MPFIQRIVDPTHVSGVEVHKSISNELECVTNHSLANVIRQLSSLSKHAEDMFSELYRETTAFFQRTSDLNSRVEHLRVKVTQLNPTEEVVQLQDIHLRKPYRSSNLHDQQVVSRITMPQAIQDMYIVCEKPPALDKLNTYREDGKDCMKFYTDPSYFFELWFADIKKDMDKQKKELKMKKGRKHRSPPSNKPVKPKEIVTKVKKYQDKSMGREFESDYQVPNIRTGGNKPIPEGYQKTSGHRPETLDGYSRSSQDTGLQQTNMQDMNNHMDNRQMNGPYNSEQYQVQPSNDYLRHQRQSQRAHNAQNQNQSPKDRRTNYNSQTIQSPSRPNVAPPPPPAFNQQRGSSMSPQRESLPPPPPPPPLEDGSSPQHQTQQMMRHPQIQNMSHGSPGGSPIHQTAMRDQDLPPPPPPPMPNTPGTPDMPPPPSPPAVLDTSPPPPPPPPPPAPIPSSMMAPAPAPPLPFNGHIRNQTDTASVSSESSSTTYSSTKEVEPPPSSEAQVPAERNALLEEIRLGNKKLKKTEERKRETAPKDKFDVHAVMTRAFDMRRRAMEDSESDDEDEDEDNDWDEENT